MEQYFQQYSREIIGRIFTLSVAIFGAVLCYIGAWLINNNNQKHQIRIFERERELIQDDEQKTRITEINIRNLEQAREWIRSAAETHLDFLASVLSEYDAIIIQKEKLPNKPINPEQKLNASVIAFLRDAGVIKLLKNREPNKLVSDLMEQGKKYSSLYATHIQGPNAFDYS